MTENFEYTIRRRPDGSIDTDFHVTRGTRLRAKARKTALINVIRVREFLQIIPHAPRLGELSSRRPGNP